MDMGHNGLSVALESDLWDTTIAAYVRYRKNLRGIVREADPTQLCTKIYALGYGEGMNQGVCC